MKNARMMVGAMALLALTGGFGTGREGPKTRIRGALRLSPMMAQSTALEGVKGRAVMRANSSVTTITSLNQSNYKTYDCHVIDSLVESAYVKRTPTIETGTSESNENIRFVNLEDDDFTQGDIVFLRLSLSSSGYNTTTDKYASICACITKNGGSQVLEPTDDDGKGLTIFRYDDEDYQGWDVKDSYGLPAWGGSEVIYDGNTVYALVTQDHDYDRAVCLRGFNGCTISKVEVMGSAMLPAKSDLTDGATKDLYIDVDRNYSKDTIISSISAKDLFGKDVPVTVTEGLDTFRPETIGVYTLKLKATDTYGQTAKATLIVHICDYKAPSVTQSKALSFVADKGQKLAYADLTNYVSVTDNGTSHGSSVTVSYAYDGTAIDSSWAKTFVAADYGTHNMKVTARDGSGNETVKTFTLTVTDGTAPVISRKDGQPANSKITVGVSRTFNLQLSDILQMYKADDNVDGDVSASLAGETDADKEFFSKNHSVGTYTLKIVAQDKDHNVAHLSVPVEVSADIPPVFVIADTIVYTDTATPLTIDAINKVVVKGILAGKNVASYSVDASEYIGNEETPGTYHVTYEYTEAKDDDAATSDSSVKARRVLKANNPDGVKSGAFALVVDDASKKEEEVKEGGFWEKVKEFFKKIGDAIVGFFKSIGTFFVKLKNWFRGVFTKWKFDCFITDQDWDARFSGGNE